MYPHTNRYKIENNKLSRVIMFLKILKMFKKTNIIEAFVIFFINTKYDTKQIFK